MGTQSLVSVSARATDLTRQINAKSVARTHYLKNYQKQWIARRRASWLAGKSCEKCGSVERLEVHHLDPSQKITHSFWSWSKPRREAELAKCAILRHDCHARETRQQRVAASKYGNPYPGVTFEARRNRWQVRELGGHRKFRGYFNTPEEAVSAAQAVQ